MDLSHKALMDRRYRRLRHSYDATRPFFLLGRKALRKRIHAGPEQRVLEVGCGTARNLILLARASPGAKFVGVDISSEMLGHAREQVRKSGLESQIELYEGELADFAASRAATEFDCVFFSYSLSMIPKWQEAVRLALSMLNTGSGTLLVADFGRCSRWSSWAARRHFSNLTRVHTTPRVELVDFLRSELAHLPTRFDNRLILGGYAEVLEVSFGSSD
ncbi:MAG: class I SAM-dependent methyltransferase [Gaiellaceae bacterium]